MCCCVDGADFPSFSSFLCHPSIYPIYLSYPPSSWCVLSRSKGILSRTYIVLKNMACTWRWAGPDCVILMNELRHYPPEYSTLEFLFLLQRRWNYKVRVYVAGKDKNRCAVSATSSGNECKCWVSFLYLECQLLNIIYSFSPVWLTPEKNNTDCKIVLGLLQSFLQFCHCLKHSNTHTHFCSSWWRLGS